MPALVCSNIIGVTTFLLLNCSLLRYPSFLLSRGVLYTAAPPNSIILGPGTVWHSASRQLQIQVLLKHRG